MDKLGELLRFDAIDTAEKITGKSCHSMDGDVSYLGLALQIKKSEALRRELSGRGDVHYGMKTHEYLLALKRHDFREVLSISFHSPSSEKEEHFFILWHDLGILLSFDTYWGGDSINGGKFYYNVRPIDEKLFRHTISSGGYRDGVWVGDHDCREAVIYHIEEMKRFGDFLNPWVKQPFLWLLHHGDKEGGHIGGGAYKDINKERLGLLPKEIQKAVLHEEPHP